MSDFDQKEFDRFINLLKGETDRGLALAGAAMVDDLLGKCIRAFLLDHPETERFLEGRFAPLASFAARTVAAFALGLVAEVEYRECEIIRKVRNEFAHNVYVGFTDQKIRDLCANLEFPLHYGLDPDTPKGLFLNASVMVAVHLQNRLRLIDDGGHRLRRLKRTPKQKDEPD